jgi:hypothetical protein
MAVLVCPWPVNPATGVTTPTRNPTIPRNSGKRSVNLPPVVARVAHGRHRQGHRGLGGHEVECPRLPDFLRHVPQRERDNPTGDAYRNAAMG